ncbi:hypothetical protein RJ639_040300 [Escallonia herrerae]|uniref:Uncharacterized protein n=1 Tax=Escallonia herrerae TaxID=1293975 RepID=A0AA89BBM7_9ASTE|nr:hypothetical protein RJ639_040300 [Escallonia herrerae]
MVGYPSTVSLEEFIDEEHPLKYKPFDNIQSAVFFTKSKGKGRRRHTGRKQMNEGFEKTNKEMDEPKRKGKSVEKYINQKGKGRVFEPKL